MPKYADNQWGLDVNTTVPFLAFRVLRERAVEKHGESQVLDLSQGEPGYGFAPNIRSREFYAFLLLLDVEFNNNETAQHFAEYEETDFSSILERVRLVAEQNYLPQKAQSVLQDFEYFLDELEHITQQQDLGYSRFQILYDIFKYSIPAGGRYPNPWGEPVTRAVVANEYRNTLDIPVQNDDVMLISGAAHGIGSVFKCLGEEGIGYLQKGDWVVMTSPVYAPYNNLMEDRGINVFAVSIDPETGEISEESTSELKNFEHTIKAMVLINPNNPSGFPYSEKLLQELADVAEQNNSLIITDEVYLQFFDDAKSILSVPSTHKRTIFISSISKIERATGIRFGTLMILEEGRTYISQQILQNHLGDYKDIFWLLYLGKSPGGKTIGAFQHITGIPGPALTLALCHLVLGKKERQDYVQALRKKMDIFYKHIGLPRRKNLYYGMFDLSQIESPAKSKLCIEQKLCEIADQGVILMPGNLFFSEKDRTESDRRSFVRVSLPNLSFENTKKAAEIIRRYLES